MALLLDAEGGFEKGNAVLPKGGGWSERGSWGLLCSALLHGLMAVLLVYMGRSNPMAAQAIDVMVPINLVQIAEETASPAQPQMAGLPQTKAADLPRKAEAVPASPKVPKTVAVARSSTRHEALAQASDDFSSQLQALARQTKPPGVPAPALGSGLSNVSAGDGRAGARAGYGVKDIIRAQVERRWEFDTATLQPGEMIVTLRLSLNGDGAVTKAEIVDDSRYSGRADYWPCAKSARRAALSASPLQLPAGSLDGDREVVVEMNPRLALR